MWIDLNKVPKSILLITNIIVIILLITATIFLIIEIKYVKQYGGQCINNPMAWAEKYAREEKGILVTCSCRQWGGDYYNPQLNLKGGEK